VEAFNNDDKTLRKPTIRKREFRMKSNREREFFSTGSNFADGTQYIQKNSLSIKIIKGFCFGCKYLNRNKLNSQWLKDPVLVGRLTNKLTKLTIHQHE